MRAFRPRPSEGSSKTGSRRSSRKYRRQRWHFTRKSTNKLLEFLGSAADLDLASVTRTTLVEFRNQVAQKASATTTNHDLRAIKALFREAKRDGYVAEDPSEFVDTVRKSFDDKRRPFTNRRNSVHTCGRRPGMAEFGPLDCIPDRGWLISRR